MAKVNNIEVIEKTDFSQKTIIITLSKIPTNEQMNELFDINEGVVLEF